MGIIRKISAMAMTAAAVAAVSCSSAGSDVRLRGRSDGGKSPVTVRVMEIRETAGTGLYSYVGTAKASKSAYVSCPYPGRLAKLNVSEGGRVKAGQVMAEIESQSVKSNYDMAMATLKQAEDGYERVRKVHSSGSVPDVKMVEAETQLAKARSAAEMAAGAMEDCKIKAPYDAVVSDVFADPGMELGMLDRIARIVDISSVEIRFSVPENEIGRIRPGMQVTADIPALDAAGVSGKVVSKGVEASPLSHTYECTAVLDRSLPELKPGMVCKVSMDKPEAAAGFVIPASSVRTDVSGRYVWTVDNGTVARTSVVISGFSGSGVVVSSGLSAGNLIITEGMQKVCTGMEVMIEK